MTRSSIFNLIELLYESGITSSFQEQAFQLSHPSDRVLENSKSVISGLFLENVSKKNTSEFCPHKNLDELKQALLNLSSPLKDSALNLVFSDGNPKAELMLIGEAPGADEDRLGRPFVGQSGQLLDKMLAAIGINRDLCYIANIIPWRPPANRTPTNEEISFFLPFVKDHIALIQPKLIVLLGGVAVKALTQRTEGIMKLRGQKLFYEHNALSIPMIPTFHPAYLLRSPSQKASAWRDWLNIKMILTHRE
jgi:DNA polymerase